MTIELIAQTLNTIGTSGTVLGLTAAAGAASLLPAAQQRIALSFAKHPSLAGHPRTARRIAQLLPYYAYDEQTFFSCDDAPLLIQDRRRAGFARLHALYQERFSKGIDAANQLRHGLSDLQFTSNYRVPFQFSQHVKTHLAAGPFVQSSAGVTVNDLDGNCFYDLTGSYGVNLLGYDFYKACIAEGSAAVQTLGPVLGAYHPIVLDNVQRLRAISGLDEVSFHMSGTEAVMQAVRLARYHTGKTHLVRFCGAYHGWWGDVQPGVGNPSTARETYTLSEMSKRTLNILRTRSDIACVLINPLQALHPNQAAPADGSLIDGSRRAEFQRDGYTEWLRDLRQICTERGIALIFDEVFVGFRLARAGAQEYFGVRADMVTYGKTLGGGLPVGVLCGAHQWMRRFKDDAPADICFARGTFNAHPYVMGTMNRFLQFVETEEAHAMYAADNDLWNARAADLNARLINARVPVQVANMASIWTVLYTQPGRYHWMLQYYLRAQGLALSWVGTGRLIFSLNYTNADFNEVAERFVNACRAMQADGWWWSNAKLTNKSIRRRVLKESIRHRLGWFNRSA